MNQFKKLTISHFNQQHLRNLDENGLPLLWPNRCAQLLRLKILIQIDDLEDMSILDVGCGFCELYFEIQRCNCRIQKYTGIDLHPKIIDIIREKHPEIDARCVDIIDSNYSDNSYDYCIGSGLFNMNMDGWRERTALILNKMYKISRFGVSVNFLRYRKDNRNPASYYAKIDEVMNMMDRLSKRYIIRGDYKENDFTVFLYKGRDKYSTRIEG